MSLVAGGVWLIDMSRDRERSIVCISWDGLMVCIVMILFGFVVMHVL